MKIWCVMGIASKKIESLRDEFEQALGLIEDRDALDEVRNHFFSRDKGRFAGLLNEIERLSPGEKSQAQQEIKQLEVHMLDRLQNLDEKLAAEAKRKKYLDLTLPGKSRYMGAAHPLRILTQEIEDIFLNMGFEIETGPEVETDYYIFEALNVPENHPARDEWQIFQVGENRFLRPHTLSAQIRVLEKKKPPVRIVIPGKAYRREVEDPTHLPEFFRIDGLVVGQGMALAHLRGMLECFTRALFHEKIRMRFRPRYFPFTEPSAAADIKCILCDGSDKNCPVCRGRGWIEIAGGGMVHSQVFKNMNIDPEKFSGFSFGIGVDRAAMIRYKVPGIRIFYENDIPIIRQCS